MSRHMGNQSALSVEAHVDLHALVADYPSELLSVREVTQLKSSHSLRATYRLEFIDKGIVKGRVLDEPAQARRLVALAPYLDKSVFPQLIAVRGHALLEEWREGLPLTAPGADQTWAFFAGKVLGALHASELNPEILEDPERTLAPQMERLGRALENIVLAGGLRHAQASVLRHSACSQAPGTLKAGLVHLDFCAENMIQHEGRLYVIDNELLDIGILDADLGRTWYRWPSLQHHEFLRGYQQFRDATGFLQRQMFWAVYTLSLAADYRLTAELPSVAVLNELRKLATKAQETSDSTASR